MVGTAGKLTSTSTLSQAYPNVPSLQSDVDVLLLSPCHEPLPAFLSPLSSPRGSSSSEPNSVSSEDSIVSPSASPLSPFEEEDLTLVHQRMALHRLAAVDVTADDYVHQLTAAVRRALGTAPAEKASGAEQEVDADKLALLLQQYQTAPW